MSFAILASVAIWGVAGLCAAAGVVGLMYWMAGRAGKKEETKRPAARTLKKHRPVLRKQKKRVMRNAVKRKRARKAGFIVLRKEKGEVDLMNPGGEQVGFFG